MDNVREHVALCQRKVTTNNINLAEEYIGIASVYVFLK